MSICLKYQPGNHTISKQNLDVADSPCTTVTVHCNISCSQISLEKNSTYVFYIDHFFGQNPVTLHLSDMGMLH